jgi:predicted DNA-binding protein
MNKVSFRIDTELLDKLNRLKKPRSLVLREALELYFKSSEDVDVSLGEKVIDMHDDTHRQRADRMEKSLRNEVVGISTRYLQHLESETMFLRDQCSRFQEQIEDEIRRLHDQNDRLMTLLEMERCSRGFSDDSRMDLRGSPERGKKSHGSSGCFFRM